MALFKTKPNLPDGEKARIEFFLQQVADCIGAERFRSPVLRLQEMRSWFDPMDSVEQIAERVGRHLDHDVRGVRIVVAPEELKKCGGGG